MPVVFLCAAVVDKAVNRFMRDDTMPTLELQVAGDLLRRPAREQLGVNIGAKLPIACELEAGIPLAASLAQRLRSCGLIARTPNFGRLTVTLKLPANRTRRASQSNPYGTHRMACLTQPIELDSITQ